MSHGAASKLFRKLSTIQRRLPFMSTNSAGLSCLMSNTCAFFHTSIPRKFDDELFKTGPRQGYSKVEEKIESMTRTEIIRNGFKILNEELKMWKQEMKEKLECDPTLPPQAGEIDILFRFDSEEAHQKWITTSDSDSNEGYSSCSLIPTQYGTAVFQGNLSSRVPLDGRIKNAGYCNLSSVRRTKSFLRDDPFDWTNYTHLVFKVRGDGRSYMLNLFCPGDYDILWSDLYHFVLYTRGGPYWQITKIPFSRFFLGAKGRVQDAQTCIPLTKVLSLGVTAADAVDGPFSLEFDYIGLEYDPHHDEDFAYEMYHVGNFIART